MHLHERHPEVTRERVVIVGGGFAGYAAAAALARRLRRGLGGSGLGGRLEVVLINPGDYFLYLPLLPKVTAGILDPRLVCVPLTTLEPRVRLLIGTVDGIDTQARGVSVTDPEGTRTVVRYDRLLVTVGSVNKLLPVPGVAEHAFPFRSIAEALRLRDHVIAQLELADAESRAAARGNVRGAQDKAAHSTFVVVGAGYTGTEVAAQGQLLSRMIARRRPGLRGVPIRWLLVDRADRVLPELDPRLSRTAGRVLAARGVEIRTGTTVQRASGNGVLLSDGEFVATHSLIWCVGVRPDPLVEVLGLSTVSGRLAVDEYLTVPGHPEIFAAGDAAGVPDLTRPGQLTPMTAQHAVRQGRRAAANLAATLGHGRRRPYVHHDLGFVVDLAGAQATANPAGVALSGLGAKALARAYHLTAIPTNRLRIGADWLLDAVLPRQTVQLGLLGSDGGAQNRQPTGRSVTAGIAGGS